MKRTLFALVLMLSPNVYAGAPVFTPEREARAQDPAHVVAAVGCLARAQDPGAYRRRAPLHYRPEQLAEYGRGVLDACRHARWADGLAWWHHVPLLLAVVQQQSRWIPDAVSRWNRGPDGERILVDKRTAWRRPDERLDYGLTQIHWGSVGRWRPGTKIGDLRNPRTNLRIGAAWLAKRSADCAQWLGARTRPRCGKHLGRGATITCRCLVTRRELGAPTWTGSTDTLVRVFAHEVWRCLDDGPSPVAQPGA